MGAFTDHIRNYPEDAEAALDDLRTVLNRALESRKIQNPKYLGYTADQWNETDKEDLLLNCYSWAVLDKLNGLTEQLKQKPNVDQLVAGNVWKFLSEQQKQANPIRYVVFVNCAAAVEDLDAVGKAFVVADTIDNHTVVKLVELPAEEALSEKIGQAITNNTGWSAVTTLILNRRGSSIPLQKQLIELIPKLTEDEIYSFVMRSLTDEITAICKQKSVESKRNQSLENTSKENSVENRIFELDLGYSSNDPGKVSPWLERLNDLKPRIREEVKSKKVAARLERIVDLLIAMVQNEHGVESIGWPEIGQQLGVQRQRIYEDRDRLMSLISNITD